MISLALAGATAIPVVGGEFAYSRFHPSPTGRDVIIVDFHMTEAGASPTRATLHSLPLGAGPGQSVPAAEKYAWAPDGQRLATYRLEKVAPADDSSRESMIAVYDRSGRELPGPGFGAAPTFLSPHLILYFSDPEDQRIASPPRLVTYDLTTGDRRVVFEFEATFTLRPEQVDVHQPPAAALSSWGGYHGVVYKRGNPIFNEPFTFLVPWDPAAGPWKGKKMILWKDDHNDGMAPPQKEPVLVVR